MNQQTIQQKVMLAHARTPLKQNKFNKAEDGGVRDKGEVEWGGGWVDGWVGRWMD